MIVLIDNYDSFTFNLFHYLSGLGADVVVHRNDKIAVDRVIAMDPDAVVLSPGPCTPNDAGICLDLIGKAAPTIPILGVCLGHQAIGQAFGAGSCAHRCRCTASFPRSSTRARACFAGSTRRSRPRATIRWWWSGASLPATLNVSAETDDRLIMGLAHRALAVHGVQFHPESIASEHGHLILRNFLDIATAWNASTGRRQAVRRVL